MAIAILSVAIMLAIDPNVAHGQNSTPAGASTPQFFRVYSINPSLPTPKGVNLETPQACVEHFVQSARTGQWRLAAAALAPFLFCSQPRIVDQLGRAARPAGWGG